MKKHLIVLLAAVMTISGLTACGKNDEPVEEAPQTLPVDVAEDTDIQYYQPEAEKAGLVPPIPIRLNGVSYETVSLNTKEFHFATATPEELLTASGTEIKADNVMDVENSDFCFYGFAAKSGKNVMFYVEFTKDGELVEDFDENELGDYEIKAVYTSSDLIGENPLYLTCGCRIFVGLQKYEIEQVDGKGYSATSDENMFFYPDVAGWTLGLQYKDGTYENTVTTTTAEPDVEEDESDNEKTDEGVETSETTATVITDKLGNEIPPQFLSGLYIFKGDAKIIEQGE